LEQGAEKNIWPQEGETNKNMEVMVQDNEQLRNLYTSNIIRVVKSREVRRVGHIACIVQIRNI
jgi:hypothetical protein